MTTRLPAPLRGEAEPVTRHLSPMAPQKAARRLDEALNGPAQPNPLMARARSTEFQGRVQGPSFWISTRAAAYNPLERRLEGTLVPLGGSTEVRVELRQRPGAAAALLGTGGSIATYTIVAVPVGLAVHSVPILGAVAGALLISLAVALWVVFAAAVYAGRRLGRAAERRSAAFVAAILDEVGEPLA